MYLWCDEHGDCMTDVALSVSTLISLICGRFYVRFIARFGTPNVFLGRPRGGLTVGGMLFHEKQLHVGHA